jgi:membrane protease YdiL (CAAX protease family)
MDENPAKILTVLADIAALAVIVGGVSVWLTIFRRILQRRPLVPFEPRRPVPWNGFDVLVVLFGYVCLGGLLVLAANQVLGWEFDTVQAEVSDVQQVETPVDEPPTEENQEEPQVGEPEEGDNGIDLERAHPVVVLLSGDSSPGTFLLCLFTVVIMAPLAEEFFFRLLLQGYFEKLDFRCQRVWRFSGQLLGLMPILLSSLLFASLHAREPEDPLPVEQLIQLFAIDSVTKILLVTGAVTYLALFRGATWRDLGFRLDTFWKDLGLALAAFLAVIVPIYLLQEGLGLLLPDKVPDPVPLFFFAIALGYLYFRTHRLMPAILLHLIFNATAICMFFAVTSSS